MHIVATGKEKGDSETTLVGYRVTVRVYATVADKVRNAEIEDVSLFHAGNR